MVQKISHEEAQEAQRKNHFAKKIRVSSGIAQVQKPAHSAGSTFTKSIKNPCPPAVQKIVTEERKERKEDTILH